MTDVRRPRHAGQDSTIRRPPIDLTDPTALEAWRNEARGLVDALRLLAFDAAAPRGERKHARGHLRAALRTRLRALEGAIDAIEPRGSNASSPP